MDEVLEEVCRCGGVNRAVEWKRDILRRLNDALSVVGTPHWLVLSDAAREIRWLRKLRPATVKGGSMKNNQVFSEGARYERKAILAKVRRENKYFGATNHVLSNLEDWILKRQQRYDKKLGGLGRK